MFCSTIIPTIGRDTLTKAVMSVLGQDLPTEDFEVIVVNDSGCPLQPTHWHRSSNIRIIDTQHRGPSVARNTGAAIARGKYLHFLDDDDWMLPGAFVAFWNLAQSTTASWLYGGTQIVEHDGNCLQEFHLATAGNCLAMVMGGEWIPIQASFISAKDFFAAGGFNTLLTGPEDREIAWKVAQSGQFAYTPNAVACVLRGDTWRTTINYRRASELVHWARERVLSDSGVFQRMRQSARSAYWLGRLVRVYGASAIWNLRRLRVAAAISRGMFASAALASAGTHLFSSQLWSAFVHEHQTGQFSSRD